tara:strand:- start:179 stop:592 length:414 start_codon:yes stop_codon:yes gene_type:complete
MRKILSYTQANGHIYRNCPRCGYKLAFLADEDYDLYAETGLDTDFCSECKCPDNDSVQYASGLKGKWRDYYTIFSIFILFGVPILFFFIPSGFALFFWFTTLLSLGFLAYLDACNYNGYIFFWLVYISWYLLWFGII